MQGRGMSPTSSVRAFRISQALTFGDQLFDGQFWWQIRDSEILTLFSGYGLLWCGFIVFPERAKRDNV